MRISRREAMRRGLVGAAGLLLADSLGLPAWADDRKQQQSQGQVGHPDLDVGRPVAPGYVRSETGGGLRLLRPVEQADPHQCRRNRHRRTASPAGQTGRQVFHHPQHDARHQRPRNGGLHGSDRAECRASGWSIRASARWSRCSRATTPATSGLIPPYIVLTEPQGRFSEAGFLGNRYKPFATGGDPAQSPVRRRRRRRPRRHRPAATRPPRIAPQVEHLRACLERRCRRSRPWPNPRNRRTT